MAGFFSLFSPRKPQAERLSDLLYRHGLDSRSPCRDDSFFDQIETEMRLNALPEEWIRRPRTFFILHQIKRIELMDDFIFHGLNDTSIPYRSIGALPRSDMRHFNHSDAEAFLDWQRLCVSPRLQLEQGKHLRLDDGDVLFEAHKEKLGNGSEMRTTVDKVQSKTTGRVYARKRISRNKLPKEAQKEFERELRALTEIEAHTHLIRVCGTYTDKRYLTLLLEPVADCTLRAFLLANRLHDPAERIGFCTFFGCMAKVLHFLHDEKQIIHKDIKPENFLLHRGRIILTDFGTAFDFSKTGHSMTRTNSDDAITHRYASPEVVRDREFRRASDVWSLGIVFLEMATVLLGRTLKQFEQHLGSHHKRSVRIHENRDAALSWLKELSSSGAPAIDNEPLAWIRDMLELSHKIRPTAAALFMTCSTSQNGRFYGSCCSEMDAADSDCDSDSDLLSSHSGATEHAEPFVTPRTSEVTTHSFESMPGAFPNDTYYTDDKELRSTDMRRPSSADGSEQLPVRSNRGRIGSNAVPMFFSRLMKPNTEIDQTQRLVISSSPRRERKSKPSRSPEAERKRTRNKSVTKKASEVSTSTTTTSLTIRDQRMNHYLMSLPSNEEHFDQLDGDIDRHEVVPHVEKLDQLPGTALKARSSKTASQSRSNKQKAADGLEKPWGWYSPSKRPRKVQSQDGFRYDELEASYRGDANGGLYGPPLIRSPSDTDLSRHLVEMESNEPDFIDNWKQWSAHLTLPATARSTPNTHHKDDEHVEKEVLTNTPAVTNQIFVATTECQNLPLLMLDYVVEAKPLESRNDEAKLLADEAAPKKKHKVVAFSETVAVDVPDTALPSMEEGAFQPSESVRSSSGAERTNNQPPSSIPNTSTEGPTPLKDFLDQVPVAKKSSRTNWERATGGVRNDQASVAPTSVISSRTRQLLSGRPFLMRYNDQYYGYLERFVKLGKVAAVRELLAGGCNPGTQRKPRWQPLLLAVKGASDRHNKCLVALLHHGADVTARSWADGKTYLHYAVAQTPWRGYSKTVGELLKSGADPKAKDSVGNTPFLSLLTGAGPLVQEERDALDLFLAPEFKKSWDIHDPNLKDNAVHLTVRRQDAFALDAVLEALKEDVRKPSMLAKRNASGFDPLLLLLSTCSFATELSENSTRMLELLLKHGADPNSCDDTGGDTALHMIISVHKSTAAMELLLQFDASLTKQNKQKVSAGDLLHEKAKEERADPWYVFAEERWLGVGRKKSNT